MFGSRAKGHSTHSSIDASIIQRKQGLHEFHLADSWWWLVVNPPQRGGGGGGNPPTRWFPNPIQVLLAKKCLLNFFPLQAFKALQVYFQETYFSTCPFLQIPSLANPPAFRPGKLPHFSTRQVATPQTPHGQSTGAATCILDVFRLATR